MGSGVAPPVWPPGKLSKAGVSKSAPEGTGAACLFASESSRSRFDDVNGASRSKKNKSDQAARPISTGKLRALQRFHTRPINLVVYEGSSGSIRSGSPNLEVSFPLRCFQRLSVPDIATRRCHWHDNRNTSGPSTRVLSYYGQVLARLLRPRQIGTELSHDVLNPARVPL